MPAPESGLREKIHLDNHFRLAVSTSALGIAGILYSLGMLSAIKPLAMVWAIYSLPYLLIWFAISHGSTHRAYSYVLSAVDYAAIALAVRATGGPQSPFFYLYPIPFLVHALYFDVRLVVLDGLFSLISYGAVLYFAPSGAAVLQQGLAQSVFLIVLLGAAFLTALRFQTKDASAERSMRALKATVDFLESLNALPPEITQEAMHQFVLGRLSDVLRPLHVHSRLWMLNKSWKTLRGIGEHPAQRPGSPHHLPTLACPAFSLKQPFRFRAGENEPCASEQFNYPQHLCLSITSDDDCFGTLFLGTYRKAPWGPEDLHLFDMLAQAIAMALHRRELFEKLEEKLSELHFSFEVGTTALATFVGSTQSIDETTVRILDGVISILKVDRASLMLWDNQNQELRTQWVRGGSFQAQSPLRLRLGEGMAGWALKTGQPYWAEYAMGDPHYLPSAQPIRSLLCVPVYTIDRQPLGVINALTTNVTRAYGRREIDFLSAFGRQAALAIENAQLHHKNRANIDQLSELNKAKSQFLSLVSHDLRGPLTGIRGFGEVLKAQNLGPLNATQMDLMQQLERQVELQERMVDDLLDLARMEKGQLSIHPSQTDLPALLKEEVEKSQAEAKERGVTLSLALANLKSVPLVEVDSDRVRQVTWNLIHNALKFTPENGRVIVRAGWFSDETVTVEVEDTGVGLAPETQDVIFDKFFQVTPGGSKGAQGLGLGLAICKEIVIAHHGKIMARSAGLGLGTTISFTLPLKAHPSKSDRSLAA